MKATSEDRRMREVFEKYLPTHAVLPIIELIKEHHIFFKIVNRRVTRYGDYRMKNDGTHQITINSTLNKYQFLMTTVHEIAHLVAFKTYGRLIKPHGKEWKHSFSELMKPFLNNTIFPKDVLPLMIQHFKNPTASSDTDAILSMELKKYDAPTNKVFIDELPLGSVFKTERGRLFKKGKLIVKRFECLCLQTRQVYLFRSNIQVELVKNN